MNEDSFFEEIISICEQSIEEFFLVIFYRSVSFKHTFTQAHSNTRTLFHALFKKKI